VVSFSLNSCTVRLIAWPGTEIEIEMETKTEVETEMETETWGFISMASLFTGIPAVSVCRQSQRQTCRLRAHKISIE